MIKKHIKYVDYNGVEKEEDFYFHFSKTELFMLESSEDGGVSEKLTKIVNKRDAKNIIGFLHDFILKSYGEKSDDGIYFHKSPEISKKFEEHPAFDILFMDLAYNPDEAINFINALVPHQTALEGTAQ